MQSEIVFDPYENFYSKAAGLIRSSEIRDLMSMAGRSDVISFAGGLPDVTGVPPSELSSLMRGVIEESFAEALQYGDTEGLYQLKTQLVRLMSEENIKAEEEHILITTGSQQALDLLARIFIDPGDLIVLEAPTYVGALTAFRPAGPRFLTIPLDGEGIRTEILEEKLRDLKDEQPKFIYVVPNFHNPAGVTMSEERRRHLIDIAQRYEILIIEDNPYGLLRFEGKPLEPIINRMPDRVIYVGTLSKVIFPGIRVGWVLAPLPIHERLVKIKQSADLCSSNLNQMFACAFLKSDLWKKNLEELRRRYKARKDAMIEALGKHFPDNAKWTNPSGGLFVWATLEEYLDTAKMLPLAIEQKVAYVPGSAFYPDYSGKNKMRLNFSYPSEEKINEGIKILGKVIRREMDLYHSLGIGNK